MARLEPGLHQLDLAAHHIVCDGWSMGVIAAELAAFESAVAAGRAELVAEAATKSRRDQILELRKFYSRRAEAMDKAVKTYFEDSRFIPFIGDITGGGFTDNVPRILPAGLTVRIEAAVRPRRPMTRPRSPSPTTRASS